VSKYENLPEQLREAARQADDQVVRAGAVVIPVDSSLLDETPEAVAGEAYELPDPAVMAELAEAQEAEQRTAQQVVTVRDEQSLNIANMAQDGAAHFLVNVEGREVCGACGKPFPCPTWTEEIEPRNTAESSGQPVPDEDKAQAVAALLGISMEQARQMVLMSTDLDKL
jgi:hypothetical protein